MSIGVGALLLLAQSHIAMTAPSPLPANKIEVLAATLKGIHPAPLQSACVMPISSSANLDWLDALWMMNSLGYLGPLPPSKETSPLKNDLGITDPELYDEIKKEFLSLKERYNYYIGPVIYADVSELSDKAGLNREVSDCEEVISFSVPLIAGKYAFVVVERKQDEKNFHVTNVVLRRSPEGWVAFAAHGF